MDTKYYLAVDIGASSGRHMLCHMEEGYHNEIFRCRICKRIYPYGK